MPDEPDEPTPDSRPDVALGTIAKEWGRIGCTGFGGPPTHIAMLRRLALEREAWIDESEFEDAIAATNLLPGPASTQLAIFCAWRLRGVPGALVGGACFICPGLAIIIGLAALFLASNPPTWVKGAALGAGPAAIGAISGAFIPLALGISHVWQVAILAGSLAVIVGLRRSVVLTLVAAGVIGAVGAALGLPVGGCATKTPAARPPAPRASRGGAVPNRARSGPAGWRRPAGRT